MRLSLLWRGKSNSVQYTSLLTCTLAHQRIFTNYYLTRNNHFTMISRYRKSTVRSRYSKDS
nr:MAG TPA_asm: hypothetical protein [Caudoviricetes sp.]